MKWNKLYQYPASSRSLIHGSRHYDVGQQKLPSVTTILAATQPIEKQRSLEAWKARVGSEQADRIKNQAATRGTAMHKYLEEWLEGRNYLDLTIPGEEARIMAQKVIEEGLHEKLHEVWGSEVTVYYPDLYAGATDVVGIYEGKQSIVDFKQSNKPKRREWIEDYFMQLAAYATAHNHVYGTNINQGVNLICTKDGLFQRFTIEGREFQKYCWDWLRRVDQYYEQKAKKKEENCTSEGQPS